VSTRDKLVELQETLYRSSNPTRRWLHCSRRDWIINAIENTPRPGNQAALEVGPASGVYLPTLARLFEKVVAVDIEEAYLSHVSSVTAMFPNLSVRVDDITESELPDQAFDLVLCTEVVEHIPDSQPAIREMRRILKPGGVLVLSTPQRYSPLELTGKIAFLPGIIEVVRLIYKEPVLKTGHINLMTAAEMTRQLTGVGFSIDASHKSGVYIPLLAEFAGETALRIEQWFERHLYGGRFDGLLWTQYYIARA
jgi:SAM-dependent methyltransferase